MWNVQLKWLIWSIKSGDCINVRHHSKNVLQKGDRLNGHTLFQTAVSLIMNVKFYIEKICISVTHKYVHMNRHVNLIGSIFFNKSDRGSRDANRCQYTCTTNPAKCHLSMTALPENPILHIQVVWFLGNADTTAEKEELGWVSSTLKLELFGLRKEL